MKVWGRIIGLGAGIPFVVSCKIHPLNPIKRGHTFGSKIVSRPSFPPLYAMDEEPPIIIL